MQEGVTHIQSICESAEQNNYIGSIQYFGMFANDHLLNKTVFFSAVPDY